MTKPHQAATDTLDPTPLQDGLLVQEQGLQLLLAEMTALASLLPTVLPTMLPSQHPAPRSEAEIEAGFDNMPV